MAITIGIIALVVIYFVLASATAAAADARNDEGPAVNGGAFAC